MLNTIAFSDIAIGLEKGHGLSLAAWVAGRRPWEGPAAARPGRSPAAA